MVTCCDHQGAPIKKLQHVLHFKIQIQIVQTLCIYGKKLTVQRIYLSSIQMSEHLHLSEVKKWNTT